MTFFINPYRFGPTAWTPASLFTGGEKGAFYDPSDFSTLFQDSAGTTPVTAAGQPVGRMLDKSGNGYHMIQATSTARPVLTADGALYYLDFDGVDDALACTSVSITSSAVAAAAGLYKRSGLYSYDRFLSLRQSGAVDYSGAANTAALYYTAADSGGKLGTYRNGGGSQMPSTFSFDTKYVGNALQKSGYSGVAVNGGTYGTGSGSTGAFNIQVAAIGNDGSGGTGKLYGRIYFLLFINRELTTQERTDLVAFINGKTGAF